MSCRSFEQHSHPIRLLPPCVVLIAWVLIASANVIAQVPFRIDVVDAENGWPVPLVELRTVHQMRFVSDNRGTIAIDLPELMGRETWFFVEGHGYEVNQDGFGYRGIRMTPMPGGQQQLAVVRRLPAKRLGRITGAGLFAESQRLGIETQWREQGILGCDSVQTAVYRGQLHWAWGDTNLARYPLGLFHMIGATTKIDALESLEPPVKLRYDYVVDSEGQPRVIAPMPGNGPTWISGLVSVQSQREAVERLVCCYVKIQPPLTAYESGLCVWDDSAQRFEKETTLWTRTDHDAEPPLMPDGHVTSWTDHEGLTWLLFGDPFPRLRCPATFEAWRDPNAWEALKPQADVPTADGKRMIRPHRGSIAWNAYRQKWVTVFTQWSGDASPLGELWYAEAESPTGPWQSAVQIVTHNNYTFYNPKLHPEFTPHGSAILIFEGTYTKEFAKQAVATPRHDYNQILYRLDLDAPPFSKHP